MPPVLYHLKVLIVHATDGHGIASELEDELAVTVYADYVTLVAGEGTGDDAELDVVLGKLLEGIVKKRHLLWMCLHHAHERPHDGVLDGGWPVMATILDQMVLRKMTREKRLYALYRALQEDKAADSRRQLLFHALPRNLVFI